MLYSNHTFTNSDVRLDGNEYKNCVFENCSLKYGGGGPVSITGCTFNNVRWALVDASQNTLQFLKGIYHGCGPAGQQLVEEVFEFIRRPAPPAAP